MSNRDLVDRVLDAGGTADWVSPLVGAARNAVVDGVTVSVWREDAPGAQAALQRAGIASWGWEVDGELATCSIHRTDLARAAALLGLDAKPVGRWHSGCTLLLMLTALGGFVAVAGALAMAIGGGGL